MPLSSDFKDLLETFNRFNVRYLIVGGHAVMYYTEPRYTKDIDVWVEASPENAARIYAALIEFGAPVAALNPKDFSEEGYFYKMGVEPVRVDILMSLEGLKFYEAWDNRIETEFDGVRTQIISLDDLIKAKKAAGRHIDLHDAEQLELRLKRLGR